MPRRPPGWHLAAGTQVAAGARSLRIPSPPQTRYWRNQAAELHEATPPVTINAAGRAASYIGPQGVGVEWHVDLVQVQTASLLPEKISVQVWRGVSGFTQNLLSSTSLNGDDMGVTGRPLRAGEQIIVIWYGATPGDTAWATLFGRKIVLDRIMGPA